LMALNIGRTWGLMTMCKGWRGKKRGAKNITSARLRCYEW
jgi:hypothetical protein